MNPDSVVKIAMPTEQEVFGELRQLFAVAKATVVNLSASESLPRSLYHFTDSAGLVGILTNKTLWATLAMSLNDESEVKFGVDRVRDIVEELFKDKGKTLVYASLKSGIAGWQDGQGDEDLWPYVVSFCARANSSFHWLHYGRSGVGVAIEFDPGKLERAGYRAVRIRYDPGEQRMLVRTVVKAVENVVEARRGREDTDTHVTFITSMLLPALLWTMTPFMKDPAFENEEEWRLVSYASMENTSEASLFRTLGGRVVPYVTIGGASMLDAIRSIVLGAQVPMSVKPLDAGLSVLLRQSFGDRRVPVSRSKVLVRP